MSDPEKVARFYDVECCGNSCIGDAECAPEWATRYVKASDYDRLLVLYRQAVVNREAYAKGLMTMRQAAEKAQ